MAVGGRLWLVIRLNDKSRADGFVEARANRFSAISLFSFYLLFFLSVGEPLHRLSCPELPFLSPNWRDRPAHVNAAVLVTCAFSLSAFYLQRGKCRTSSKCLSTNTVWWRFSPHEVGDRFFPPLPSLPHPGSRGEAIIEANYLQIGPM